MTPSKLAIISGRSSMKNGSSHLGKKQQSKMHFDRLWMLDPEQFNPLNNEIHKERIKRTWQLLTAHTELENRKFADLGCGYGVLAQRLRDKGAFVTAVDVSSAALKRMKKEEGVRLTLLEDCLPRTQFADGNFEAIVCTDVIADLEPRDYRLFFSELARILENKGILICSTEIDYQTEDASSRFLALARTEFDILETIDSFNRLSIQLCRFLKAPEKYFAYTQSPELYREERRKRKGISKQLFRIGCWPCLKLFWRMTGYLFRLACRYLENSPRWIGGLEKATKMLYGTRGVSHVIFAGRRRSL